MKLRTRFFALLAVVFALFTAAAWYFTEDIVSAVDARWAYQFSQRQVQFDKHRTLMPLTREIALARQLAVEPAILEMAKDEDNSQARAKAFEVLERYRRNFRDQSYFIVLRASGNYYFNDAENSYAGRELRYRLHPEDKKDQWFYATLKSGKAYQINLDPDANLNVTKVWINVLVVSGEEVLGMVGTGIDITTFLKETVDIGQPGIHNIFIDDDMAVQLYRDASLIDYASIAKASSERKKVDAILKKPGDIAALQEVMTRLKDSPYQVQTIPVTYDDRQYLLGVAYLPEIGWYELTLMDTKDIFLLKNFFMLPAGLTVLLLAAILAFGSLLNRRVILPMTALSQAAVDIERGSFETAENLAQRNEDEIGDVTRAFRRMALALKEYTSKLEKMVEQRTEALEKASFELQRANEELDRLSRTDRLTQISNRFDLMERINIEVSRARRGGHPCGIIMLDLDYFKAINDRFGHSGGDEVLKVVAATLARALRAQDVVGRWGGEEFMILLPGNGLAESQVVAEKLRVLIEQMEVEVEGQRIAVTASQGVSVFLPGQEQEVRQCVEQADKALYQAKDRGRNRVALYGTEI